jgi:hypothetical protein
MKGRRGYVGALAVSVLLVVAASGCGLLEGAGDVQTDTETIELGTAETAVVHLRMVGGRLMLSGGADALAEASFMYSVADWRPTIDYAVSGGEGELWIEQPDLDVVMPRSYRYEWRVELSDAVPLELDVELGAGQGEIDVSSLTLTRLDLDMGAGDLEVNLRGERDRDVEVAIRGGIGAARLLLPDDVGVRATVEGGLGDVDVLGMTREDGAYVNEAYGEAETTMNLAIEAGVGDLTLDAGG